MRQGNFIDDKNVSRGGGIGRHTGLKSACVAQFLTASPRQILKHSLVKLCLIGLILTGMVTNTVTATPPCMFRENHIWLTVTEVKFMQPYSIGCETIVAEIKGWDQLNKKNRKILVSNISTTAYCYQDENGEWGCEWSNLSAINVGDTAVALIGKYTKPTHRVAFGIQFKH